MKAFTVILGIIISNYLFAYFNVEVNYEAALERSYFSTVGVIVYLLTLKLTYRG